MLNFSEIILFYTIFIIYIVISCLIGHLIQSDKKNTTGTNVIFHQLFSGIIIITGSTALITTGFTTVYLGLLLLLLYLIKPLRVNNSQNIVSSESASVKSFNLLLITGSLFFLLNLLFHRTLGDTKIPHEDYLFYSQLANNLYHGYEGLNYKLFATGILTFKQLTPYHYFELWTAVPIIGITGNPVWALNLVVYPLLQTIAFFGLYALVTHFISANRSAWLVTLLLFFIGGLQFDFMHQFIARNYTGFITDTTLFSQFGRKYGIIFITLYFAIYHFLKGNNKYFLTGISLTAFFYPTVSPGILIFILLYAYKQYHHNLKTNLWVLIPITLTILPAFFYGLLSLINHSTHLLSKESSAFMLQLNYKAGIWFLIISALSLGIYLIPLFRVRKELTGPLKTITLIVAIVIGIGFLISITIPMQRDQIQFYSNTLPFFLILVQLSLIIWFDKNHLWGFVFLAVVSAFVFFKNFEKQNGFNRAVSEVTTPKQKSVFKQLMKEHSPNSMYGFIWDSTKIGGLNEHSNLFLSSNYGYLKIHGYVNAINMSNLANDKKSIPYDEPFLTFSFHKTYDEALHEFIYKNQVCFVLNEIGEPINEY